MGNKIVTYLNAQEKWKYTPIETAKLAEDTGAGEILLPQWIWKASKGYDLELVQMVSEAVTIPVIAHGGCSSTSDIRGFSTPLGHPQHAARFSLLKENTKQCC